MKKIVLLACTAVICMSFVVADWVTVKMDDRASVDFPVQPKIQDLSGNQVWIADFGENSRCMSMTLDFANYGLDSAMIAKEMEGTAFAEGFKGGVLGQIAGSTLISEKDTTILGYPVLEYVIDMGKKDNSQLNIMHNRNIFVGSKMYSLSFFEKTGKPQDADREKFFSSLKIAK